MAFASETDARDAYAGTDANAARLVAVMAGAAGMVQRVAPAPAADSPLLLDYEDLAAAAELIAGEWLWETGGYLASSQAGDTSDRYASRADVEETIAAVMGAFAGTAANAAGAFSLEIASTYPEPPLTP